MKRRQTDAADDDDADEMEPEDSTDDGDESDETEDESNGDEDEMTAGNGMTEREQSARKEREMNTEFDRAVRAGAEKNNGVLPTWETPFYKDESRVVPLDATKPKPTNATTEELLNGLIEDCRFLIHELVYHSARLTPDPSSRLSFIGSARSLAITAGAIGKTIARLRSGEPDAAPVQERRYRMIHEHVQTPPSLPPEKSP